MSVSNPTDKVIYNGDGTTVSFTITFQYLQNADIAVQVITLSTGSVFNAIAGVDYNIVGANVVFVVAPLTGTNIILLRNIAILQPVSLPENNPFPSAVVEAELDRLTMICQQIGETIGRTLVLSPNVSTSFDSTITPPSAAGLFLQVNGTGTGFQFVPIASGSGIASVNADPSPTLGGNLNINAHNIVDKFLNPLLSFGGVGTSVVNSNAIQVNNAGSGAPPSLNVIGNNTNISLNIITKGTGVLTLSTAAGGNSIILKPAVLHSIPSLTVGNGDTDCPLLVMGNGAKGVQLGTPTGTSPVTWVFGSLGNLNVLSHNVPTMTAPRTVTWPDASFTVPTTSGSVVLLGTVIASNQATVPFTGLTGSLYSEYILKFDKIIPITNNVSLVCQISQSTTIQMAGYSEQVFRFTSSGNGQSGSSTTFWNLMPTETLGTGTNQAVSGEIRITNPASTGPLKISNWQLSGITSSGSGVTQIGGGQMNNSVSAVIDGVVMATTSGNISSGTFKLYGVLA